MGRLQTSGLNPLFQGLCIHNVRTHVPDERFAKGARVFPSVRFIGVHALASKHRIDELVGADGSVLRYKLVNVQRLAIHDRATESKADANLIQQRIVG